MIASPASRAWTAHDPADLTRVAVFHHDRHACDAVPETIKAHVDLNLAATQPQPQPGPPTGIAYLDAVAADHAAALRKDRHAGVAQ